MLEGLRGGEVIGRTRHAGAVRRLGVVVAIALGIGLPAAALDSLSFSFPGADKKLRAALLSASLLEQAERDGPADALDLFAAARTDYGRILGALYAEGYYSGVIHILIDGREAADFAAVDAPRTIRAIKVIVVPGAPFTFLRARMKPYAPGTKLPPAYGDRKVARSTAIADAAAAGVAGWRSLGYAKASIVGQSIIADHQAHNIDAEILLDAGPRLRFGKLNLSGNDHLATYRVVKIAGFHEGAVFNPEVLDKMATRLRRTGIFRSVAITEAQNIGPGGTLDIDMTLLEEAPRRFGFGAEVSSADGANLSAFWLHRNFLGGGERLRIDGVIKGIGGQSDILEYQLGGRIERPGTPFTDSSAFIAVNLDHEEILDLEVQSLSFGIGATRVITETLTAEASLSYVASSIEDATFRDEFNVLALPVSLKWDRRNDTLAPTKGNYLNITTTPFWGFGTTDSGTQFKVDARAYRAVGPAKRFVLAGRVQLGTVLGTALLNTPPDFLFYSGGGGTVRGHPFQSLGVTVQRSGMTVASGGLSFVGLSGEARAAITDKLGAVAFYDAGYIGANGMFDGGGPWQAGAGFGVRYDTGFGPVRLDVAFPVSGTTGNGMQVYVGIGQSF